jgi:hypothetical protein
MARVSKAETESKLKALRYAIDKLKSESTPTSNLLTYDRVCEVANECELSKEWKTKISVASLKQPSTQDFISLRVELQGFKKEVKQTKTLVADKTKDALKDLQDKVEILTYKLAECIDKELSYIEQLKEKDDEIRILKAQRDAR